MCQSRHSRALYWSSTDVVLVLRWESPPAHVKLNFFTTVFFRRGTLQNSESPRAGDQVEHFQSSGSQVSKWTYSCPGWIVIIGIPVQYFICLRKLQLSLAKC